MSCDVLCDWGTGDKGVGRRACSGGGGSGVNERRRDDRRWAANATPFQFLDCRVLVLHRENYTPQEP